jgi:hypothetical protein
MKRARLIRLGILTAACLYVSIAICLAIASQTTLLRREPRRPFDQVVEQHASRAIAEGRQTFRYDTFGDEDFWGGVLQLHDAIQGLAFGGVGDGLTPRKALELGLKVDLDALPRDLRDKIRRGAVNLDDPAVTLALLRLNAVVGITGFFENGGQSLSAVGIQCALCHSTVDNALAPGIGRRLDGWANRDLNIGAIVALSPNLQPIATLLHKNVDEVKTVLGSWGPGKFDALLFMDGQAFQPDGRSAATLIPPAFGLAGVNLHTWEGWGSVTHWNAFVANLEMHGHGTFFDTRLDDAAKFPIAAENRFGHLTSTDDRITAKLPALHLYQMALPAPAPPSGSFDEAAAEEGDRLFSGKARCASCHTEGLYTEPGWNMHRGEEVGVSSFQANRGPDGRYRTAPLKGLWTHTKGGFYHDGRFATLLDVVDHYDSLLTLGLEDDEKASLVEYLKSLGDDVPPSVIHATSLNAGLEAGNERTSAAAISGSRLAVWPSPLENGEDLHVLLALGPSGEWPLDLQMTVHDVAGRRVGRIGSPAADPAGSISWRPREETGRALRAGVYFVRFTAPSIGMKEERRIVIR